MPARERELSGISVERSGAYGPWRGVELVHRQEGEAPVFSRRDAGAVEPERLVWNLIVLMSGIVYLVATLFGGIDSPFFGLLMLVMLGREITGPRLGPHAGARSISSRAG